MTIDETFDVGIDTRTPVDDKDYQVPFRFTGKIAKLTFKLGPLAARRGRPQDHAHKHYESERLGTRVVSSGSASDHLRVLRGVC